MKITLLKVKIILSLFILSGLTQAQTVSTFENLSLPTNTYWNGKDFSGGFTSGNAYFVNHFDTTFGDYWEGFSASTTTNDSTKSYTNQYSAITAKGYNNSKTYAVNYATGKIRLTGVAKGKVVNGFYITNSTYSYYAMKNGTPFSKKFGDSSGNYPDFFKVIIMGWGNGGKPSDTVEFYLADYRFSDNSKDYILKTWQWVDLSKLGNLDSLSFNYISSDTGKYGINNPQYFCMDNFTTSDVQSGLTKADKNMSFTIYPNPAYDVINILCENANMQICIFDLQGALIIQQTNDQIDISNLKQGMYMIEIITAEGRSTQKLIKP